MEREIDSAVQFLCGLLRARSLAINLISAFETILSELMFNRYKDHWFPEKPSKGSAYRCMRINDMSVDPLILEAGSRAGLSQSQLLEYLPSQLTIWVDPRDVSYRFGEDGSIGSLYGGESNESSVSQSSDQSQSSSQSNRSTSSSPSSEPECRLTPPPNPSHVQQHSVTHQSFSLKSGVKWQQGSSCRQEMKQEYLHSMNPGDCSPGARVESPSSESSGMGDGRYLGSSSMLVVS